MSVLAGQPPPGGPVLLYDGSCGFCVESVQLILKHDRRKTLRFASLHGAFGRAVLERHADLADVDSVLWVVPGGENRGAEVVLTRSAAALQVAEYLGGVWRAATLARLMPRGLRDAVYRLLAKHRHELAAQDQPCLVPTPEERARFLD